MPASKEATKVDSDIDKISLVVLAVTRTIGRSSSLRRPGVKNARSTNFYSAAMVAWAAVHAGQCQVCKHFLHKEGRHLAVEWVNCLITANGKGRRKQLTSLRKKIFEHSKSSAHNSAETILRGKKEERMEKLAEKMSAHSRVKRPVEKQFADVITADVISRTTFGSGRSTSGFGRSRHFRVLGPDYRGSCLTRRSLTLTITTSGRHTSGSGVFPVPNPTENNIATVDLVG